MIVFIFFLIVLICGYFGFVLQYTSESSTFYDILTLHKAYKNSEILFITLLVMYHDILKNLNYLMTAFSVNQYLKIFLMLNSK